MVYLSAKMLVSKASKRSWYNCAYFILPSDYYLGLLHQKEYLKQRHFRHILQEIIHQCSWARGWSFFRAWDRDTNLVI
jgi:hypothetical protein